MFFFVMPRTPNGARTVQSTTCVVRCDGAKRSNNMTVLTPASTTTTSNDPKVHTQVTPKSTVHRSERRPGSARNSISNPGTGGLTVLSPPFAPALQRKSQNGDISPLPFQSVVNDHPLLNKADGKAQLVADKSDQLITEGEARIRELDDVLFEKMTLERKARCLMFQTVVPMSCCRHHSCPSM